MSYDKVHLPVGSHDGRAGLPGFNGLAPPAGPNGCNGRHGRKGIQGQMSPNPDNGNNGMNGVNQSPLPNSDNSDNGTDAQDGKLICYENWYSSSISGVSFILWNSSTPPAFVTTQMYNRSTFLPNSSGQFTVDTAGMYEFTLKVLPGASTSTTISVIVSGAVLASVNSSNAIYAETQCAKQLAVGDTISFTTNSTTITTCYYGVIMNVV